MLAAAADVSTKKRARDAKRKLDVAGRLWREAGGPVLWCGDWARRWVTEDRTLLTVRRNKATVTVWVGSGCKSLYQGMGWVTFRLDIPRGYPRQPPTVQCTSHHVLHPSVDHQGYVRDPRLLWSWEATHTLSHIEHCLTSILYTASWEATPGVSQEALRLHATPHLIPTAIRCHSGMEPYTPTLHDCFPAKAKARVATFLLAAGVGRGEFVFADLAAVILSFADLVGVGVG